MSRFGATKVWARSGAFGAMAGVAGWVAACSSSSSPSGTASGALGSDGGVDSAAALAENFDATFDGQSSLNLKWQVTEQPAIGYGFGDAGGVNAGAGDGGMATIAGVEVCVYQNTAIPCVMTDDNGVFNLGGLPPRTNIVLSIIKDGYQKVLKPIQTASADMDGTSNPVRMLSLSDPDPPVPFTIDWVNSGNLSFFALGDSADSGNLTADVGATAAISPSAGKGPLYISGDGTFDLSATALESGGVGYYYNLPPGNYTLTFTDTVHNCAPLDVFFAGYGFPDPPTSVEFPIVAGYGTELVGVLCTDKPRLVDAGQ